MANIYSVSWCVFVCVMFVHAQNIEMHCILFRFQNVGTDALRAARGNMEWAVCVNAAAGAEDALGPQTVKVAMINVERLSTVAPVHLFKGYQVDIFAPTFET